MIERKKYSLFFLRDDLKMDWIREWFEVGCDLFRPLTMSGEKLTQNRTLKFNRKKFFNNLYGKIENGRINVSVNDRCNDIYVCMDSNIKDIVRFNLIIAQEIDSGHIDEIIEKLMQNGGIVAHKCSLTDNHYQNEEEISHYELMDWNLNGVRTKSSKIGPARRIIDIEYNPGHSHIVNGIWFGSCYRMWFGKEFYQYISKEKLQSFSNCYENIELENEVTRITLYKNLWDFAKPENREIQWDFRRSVGMDEVAHALEEEISKKKVTDPEVEIKTGSFPHGGVRLIHQYFDGSGNITHKSKAKIVKSAEYSADGKILFSEENSL